MTSIETESQLEEMLASPSASDIETMRRLRGDVMVLGAGGKMGPSLARRLRRAANAANAQIRVTAVSRFSSPQARDELQNAGVETISCDLLDRAQIARLPECENVLFLAGRKFGSSERSDLTWAINTMVPANVAERFRASRIVAFSTGNIYPPVPPSSGGSLETDATEPRGEYAQSCLGRERIFEYFSREYNTRCLLFRLNYAVDLRYGVLVDIARKVYEGEPVSLSIANFNAVWQGDANSYALRSLELCESPPQILNVTGPETISTKMAAEFFARRFKRDVIFQSERYDLAFLNNASHCHKLLGYPAVSLNELMDMVAHWVEARGAYLNKPAKYEVTDGRY